MFLERKVLGERRENRQRDGPWATIEQSKASSSETKLTLKMMLVIFIHAARNESIKDNVLVEISLHIVRNFGFQPCCP
jgi:hypothetical protein